ncbi:single-stranded DNA-binding protein [Pseudonocardia sp. CA-107938]|uniref:single-stranded DNA-binding protein n=1 Tax=Pseudonocardia sp. CA-107938 TaxID=3240021 RepID=UPI003D8B75EA
MYETIVTAVGRVATIVSSHRFGDGPPKASFRLACNERRRDWSSGNWVDGDTVYFSVSCWRSLAENVQHSLRVGDPVVVRGRMHTRDYETPEGRRTSVVELDATAIGPDLARCTTVVTRAEPVGRGTGRQEAISASEPRGSGGEAVAAERELVGAAAGGPAAEVPMRP